MIQCRKLHCLYDLRNYSDVEATTIVSMAQVSWLSNQLD